MIDRKKLRELCENATPGPWTHEYHIGQVDLKYQPECCEEIECRMIAQLIYSGLCRSIRREEENAEFIAAARNALPELLDLLDECELALEKIADPRKRDHSEPDAYTTLGCVMNIANDMLEKIKG